MSTQTDADSAAIKETLLNYVEGWYEGNAARMKRALYPDLAKSTWSK
ncbi:MAG: nuclear transport factor 2 family protein [Steroidobacteraceae bacterium]